MYSTVINRFSLRFLTVKHLIHICGWNYCGCSPLTSSDTKSSSTANLDSIIWNTNQSIVWASAPHLTVNTTLNVSKMKNETEEEAYHICEMHIVMRIIQLFGIQTSKWSKTVSVILHSSFLNGGWKSHIFHFMTVVPAARQITLYYILMCSF